MEWNDFVAASTARSSSMSVPSRSNSIANGWPGVICDDRYESVRYFGNYLPNLRRARPQRRYASANSKEHSGNGTERTKARDREPRSRSLGAQKRSTVASVRSEQLTMHFHKDALTIRLQSRRMSRASMFGSLIRSSIAAIAACPISPQGW